MEPINMEQFLADRREALLSLDLEKVRAYARKYGEPTTDDDQVLTIAIHQARCAALDLPLHERTQSADWLAAHGYAATVVSRSQHDH